VGSTSGFWGIIQSGEYTIQDRELVNSGQTIRGSGVLSLVVGRRFGRVGSGDWGCFTVGDNSGSGEGIIYATHLYKQNEGLLIGVLCHELEPEPTREGFEPEPTREGFSVKLMA
jgi:hypothetical protein